MTNKTVSLGAVSDGLKIKEAATALLGESGFAEQANQEHHNDYQQTHFGLYGTSLTY